MGIKINLGVCKKIGLPDYGSAGSHCDIEIEMDLAVLNNPEEFQRRVRHAYGLARESVETELAGHKPGNTVEPQTQQERPTTPPKTEYRNAAPPGESRFQASEKQMKFIGQLCRGIKGLSNRRLDEYCQTTFGKLSTQLSAQDASKLIDALKEAKEKGGLA